MTNRILATMGLAASLVLSTPAAAQLSAAEETIVSTVEEHFETDVALLERLVVQNSGTHNHEGVRAVADMLVPEFEALGFSVEFIDQSHVGRAGHLFARHEGRPGSTRMLLIGHMDTVFEPDSPFQDFTRDGNVATGPGIEDDKGGIIVILSALRAMQAAGTLEDANIVVALTGDEEDVGDPIAEARADLLAAGEWADVTLGFEGLSIVDGRDMGVTARRSSNSWELRISAGSGHSSGIFHSASSVGAIYELARILDAFRTQLPEENLTFNVGLVAGGTPAVLAEDGLSATTSGKTNIIPDSAVARGDLRTISQEQTERVVARMQEIVADGLPGTEATLEVEFRYPPMSPTEGNAALLARLNAVNADLGLAVQEPIAPIRRGAADISFVAPLTDALAGMGASGRGTHAPGESLDLTSLTRQSQRAAILMSRLAQEEY
ncbi:M20/M25/M40 family metallo-hydrolase [Aurantiacibacter sp. MUD11]|uniref:M20/M25/M40 family metallo-hydrolase n=1 Tax=Aurantiacibacter sp. MUD11 TaxID=3003265 RepID=UPI0022AA54C8|nr:M20/M25/M40 family metallo-hydrolase [Aurantiacibacter sp. MUD11]WAT18149.1 M20/M25/M40 family metallo-hydrolase [Aurantiacibacter sp. MUD11]